MQKDELLLKNISEGDMKSLSELIERYRDPVFRICFSYLKDQEDAEEIAQDVFVQIFESASEFRMESAVKTWIYRIAINKSLEKVRWKSRKKRFGFMYSFNENLNMVPSSFMPGKELERSELRSLLHSEIRKLPENQRTAFILHKLEGLAHKEIAEILTLSISAVESLIFRAKKNLKESLSKYLFPGARNENK